MKKVIHRAHTRGKGDYGWLSTRYSFSFANWYDPARMGFGALRVLNDDTIAPASGFPMHSHRNMEIITIVTNGTLTHKDSLGNTGTVKEGEVQVMSAGTGITHSEYNASTSEPLSLFQLWIETGKSNSAPRYEQTRITSIDDELTLLVGPINSNAPVTILQDAYITRARITPRKPISYSVKNTAHGIYIFVVSGTVSVDEEKLGARDAMGVKDVALVELHAPENSDVLLIEVPIVGQ